MLLNIKRTSFLVATIFTLGLTTFMSAANAEPTVYQGNNGTSVQGNRGVACQGINGGTVYSATRRGAVKLLNGITGVNRQRRSVIQGTNVGAVYSGVRGGAVKTLNGDGYIITPSGVYKIYR
ncbi:MAG: hypothetical protein HRU34_22590 [Richelia sp.]|nr:hypothetical protein [Richelia sp.]